MSDLSSMDWKALKPNAMALLLTQKPFPASGGGVIYLNLRQAMLFALRAYELGLSPLSDNVWYDSNRGAVNVTLSGKRELARLRGLDLGPPMFEEVSRDWDEVAKTNTAAAARKAGFPKDVGIRCHIRVGPVVNNERVNYVAWLSEWFVERSPVWKERPTHMLSIRANEKALTLVLGTGASAMPDEKEHA